MDCPKSHCHGGGINLYIPTYICSKAVMIQWTVVESESQDPIKTDLTFYWR